MTTIEWFKDELKKLGGQAYPPGSPMWQGVQHYKTAIKALELVQHIADTTVYDCWICQDNQTDAKEILEGELNETIANALANPVKSTYSASPSGQITHELVMRMQISIMSEKLKEVAKLAYHYEALGISEPEALYGIRIITKPWGKNEPAN